MSSEITNTKCKNAKKYNTKYTENRTHIYYMRAEIRRQSVSSFDLSWEYVSGNIFFCCYAHVQVCVDFEVTSIY